MNTFPTRIVILGSEFDCSSANFVQLYLLGNYNSSVEVVLSKKNRKI